MIAVHYSTIIKQNKAIISLLSLSPLCVCVCVHKRVSVCVCVASQFMFSRQVCMLDWISYYVVTKGRGIVQIL